MKVAIVGGGIMGLCTAKSLAERGHAVTVFEQYGLNHALGSSTGRSRIVRQAYPDSFYTEILLEGHQLWTELEAQANQEMIHLVGLLYIGPKDEPEMWHELETLEQLSVRHEVLTAASIGGIHPQMNLGASEIAVLTRDAGWADVPAVLSAVARLASDRGAQFLRSKVDHSVGAGFDCAVVTAGSWIKDWADPGSPPASSLAYGEASAKPRDGIRVTLQSYAYLEGLQHGPVWIEGFGDHSYGFPSEPGRNDFKIGHHEPGPETDPDDPDRTPPSGQVQAIKEAAWRRFGVRNAHVTESRGCLYTVAPGDDFKIGWLDDRTLLASPCSGHGFKFGPWMGRFLADLVEGKRDLGDWPRFLWHPRHQGS
ncbi:MAG: FAD-dependent oxidoreductase [Fimbriimonadaceae bacterium]|nr:FAD-dependent oxidoreductase [Fimbriimonadaceae bacterium]QYK58360.1 MAG: FAD-dependent oxidoreductase [Fimbriimonadaceae bacterium]